jgi:hypothetical protein
MEAFFSPREDGSPELFTTRQGFFIGPGGKEE